MSDIQARTVVGVIALLITGGIAELIWGDPAVHIVLAAVVIWLAWDRIELLDRVDEMADSADKAQGPRAPECEPDEPWRSAPPVNLADLETAPAAFGPQPLVPRHPFPEPPSTPQSVPEPTPPVDDDWLERQHRQAMAALDLISLTPVPQAAEPGRPELT